MSPLRPAPSTLKEPSRVEFTLENFRDQIQYHGYEVRWSRAALCPNRDPNQSDHHRVSCTLCDHHGFVYFEPTTIWALATSYGAQQMFIPEGRYEPGTAYFTTLPEHKLSFWDKLELLSAEARFTEVVPVNGTQTYRLRYPVIRVAFVVSSNNTEPELDTFEIDETGRVIFDADSLPTGNFLSFSYFYHPTYIIIDLLHQVRNTRVTLLGEDQEIIFPSQAVGRLDFLIRDEGATT